jgi:hypothetical protein
MASPISSPASPPRNPQRCSVFQQLGRLRHPRKRLGIPVDFPGVQITSGGYPEHFLDRTLIAQTGAVTRKALHLRLQLGEQGSAPRQEIYTLRKGLQTTVCYLTVVCERASTDVDFVVFQP